MVIAARHLFFFFDAEKITLTFEACFMKIKAAMEMC
jgi:hypothetical protein